MIRVATVLLDTEPSIPEVEQRAPLREHPSTRDPSSVRASVDELRRESIRFFRGLLVGGLLAASLWAALLWATITVLRSV